MKYLLICLPLFLLTTSCGQRADNKESVKIYDIPFFRHQIDGVHINTALLEIMACEYPYIDYPDVVKRASEGSKEDIYLLCSLQFDCGFIYEHGSVLVDLIEILGEDKCVDMMKDIDYDQAIYFDTYISVGLCYGWRYGNNPDYDYRIKDIYPRIDSLLLSKERSGDTAPI